jgi:hypothetical protein
MGPRLAPGVALLGLSSASAREIIGRSAGQDEKKVLNLGRSCRFAILYLSRFLPLFAATGLGAGSERLGTTSRIVGTCDDFTSGEGHALARFRSDYRDQRQAPVALSTRKKKTIARQLFSGRTLSDGV